MSEIEQEAKEIVEKYKPFTHGSLFSGIGGFDLAAEWMGWNNIFHCEWNPFGQKVLKHHFPNSISYNDITKTDFSIHRGRIDILTGGFPCQPYSLAGKRLGKEDERHLWPHMLRAIQEIKPRWVVGENVRGLVSWNDGLVFHEVQSDLETQGYEVQPFLIPAAGVNAPHQRYRIWFVAYSKNENVTNSNSGGLEGAIKKRWYSEYVKRQNEFNENSNVKNTDCIGQKWRLHKGESKNAIREQFSPSTSFVNGRNTWHNFPTKSPLCGGDDGLPRKLDNITFPKWRAESVKAYGNAIVPQVAYEIFKAIQTLKP